MVYTDMIQSDNEAFPQGHRVEVETSQTDDII